VASVEGGGGGVFWLKRQGNSPGQDVVKFVGGREESRAGEWDQWVKGFLAEDAMERRGRGQGSEGETDVDSGAESDRARSKGPPKKSRRTNKTTTLRTNTNLPPVVDRPVPAEALAREVAQIATLQAANATLVLENATLTASLKKSAADAIQKDKAHAKEIANLQSANSTLTASLTQQTDLTLAAKQAHAGAIERLSQKVADGKKAGIPVEDALHIASACEGLRTQGDALSSLLSNASGNFGIAQNMFRPDFSMAITHWTDPLTAGVTAWKAASATWPQATILEKITGAATASSTTTPQKTGRR
jgi:hypothetical protein